MNDTSKVALSAGIGILIGKTGGSFAWWLLAGCFATSVLSSPVARGTITSGAKTAYEAYKNK